MFRIGLGRENAEYVDLSNVQASGQSSGKEAVVLSQDGKASKTSSSSWNWKVTAAISVVALGILAVIAYTKMYPPLEMTEAWEGGVVRPRQLDSILRPLCKKAVEERCTPDGSLCLKDFLEKDWEPRISALESTSSNPLCFPPVSKELAQHVTYKGGDNLFQKNYGETCTVISEAMYRLPEMRWLDKYYKWKSGVVNPSQWSSTTFRKDWDGIKICFKSHLSS